MKDIVCNHMACRRCKRAIRIKIRIINIRLYKCDNINRKHREVRAKECEGFLCKDRDDAYQICRECRKGN